MSSPAGAPGRWPLLSVTPGRLQLIQDLQAVELPGTLAPSDLRSAFEACETARARYTARRLDDARSDLLARLAWRPADPAVREFLTLAFARAADAGGLRLLADEALPIECLRDCGGDWSTAFPTVRLMRGAADRLPAASGTARSADSGTGSDASPRRVLIWSNPEGTPELPAAQAEADLARELFEVPGFTVRWLGRHLSEGDWHAAVAESDIVLYYGHGLAGRAAAGMARSSGCLSISRLSPGGPRVRLSTSLSAGDCRRSALACGSVPGQSPRRGGGRRASVCLPATGREPLTDRCQLDRMRHGLAVFLR